MPPEKSAYALARYSRSPDSIRESIDWVRSHDSSKFLDSFYFQYGHASIADLGHLTVCFEGVSELAATEIEDEQLWDGQARSSRYQDFGVGGFITPPEFDSVQAEQYGRGADKLLACYRKLHSEVIDHLSEKLPRPESMKPDAYKRNIAARAFDVARYCLFFGVPTGVGQVVSIRTLERQIRRLKTSEYAELRSLGDEVAAACARPPSCVFDENVSSEPLAPTLAKYVDADGYAAGATNALRSWWEANAPATSLESTSDIEVISPVDRVADIAATLLFPVSDRPFRELYEWMRAASPAFRREVLDAGTNSRVRKEELLRGFRTAPYAFDLVMDLGAYRDMHRHRRCQQFRQGYGTRLGYSTPAAVKDAGLSVDYRRALDEAFASIGQLPEPGAHYLLPFATRSRFLFKMDFAEAEYICRLRSGVKGHFSYREVAWAMKESLSNLEPELSPYLQATPPWVEDPLQR